MHANPAPRATRGTARRAAEVLGTRNIRRVASIALVTRVGPDRRRAVPVRAELDTLPIKEQTGAPFAAKGGFMRACGHDPHIAALVAFFRATRRSEDFLAGSLLAPYHPSEESYPSGAGVIACVLALGEEVGVFVAAYVHPEAYWDLQASSPAR